MTVEGLSAQKPEGGNGSDEVIGRPPWYRDSFDGQLTPAMRQLLEEYCGIPAAEVEQHIYTIRNQAWAISSYPCIGAFSFLTLSLSKHPYYQLLLERLKSGDSFLDLGCCFGQDVRKLVYDGVSADHLYGSDLQARLLALGFDLFRDNEKWTPGSFFAADIFATGGDAENGLEKLRGKVDVIQISMFLHLFSYEQQISACTRLTEILTPKPGSMIVGSHGATTQPRDVPSRRDPNKVTFLHDVQSFENLWLEVGEKTNSKWKVDATLTKPWETKENLAGNKHEDRYFNGDDMRWLVFTVERLE